MIYYDPSQWQGRPTLPPLRDLRWRVLALLSTYLVLGMTFLGFSRKPLHVLLLIGLGALLDMLLQGLVKNRWIFPLSAMISCCSLAILLNWSYDLHNLFLPIFVCIGSKYLITLKGRHFFNPSLFAICFCILFGGEYITLSPSYQWYGSSDSAWVMMYFVATAALMFFVFKINRSWLIGSFLLVFLLQTVLRAYVMEHIIPFETLFVGSLTSPAFYLFTFYMITDPATSPSRRSDQVMVGTAIALLDLVFHLKFSLYTFFFAGITVAALRYGYMLVQTYGWRLYRPFWQQFQVGKYAVLGVVALPVCWSFGAPQSRALPGAALPLALTAMPAEHSGLQGDKGDVLERVDPAVQHVAKWILSVGDAVAVADVNGDSLPDLFLTQPLKTLEQRAKLWINQGDFRFEPVAIPDLERYLDDPQRHGLPGTALFLDYDNDGDPDLFVGFGFGKSHLFENRPGETPQFVEVPVPFLLNEHTVCLAANALDYDADGRLDLLVANTLPQYLPDYDEARVPLNIFDLPAPRYEGDRRRFHFMHESWHNANNGGLNHLLRNTGGDSVFAAVPPTTSRLTETRWSLAIGTLDMNDDGYTDLFIANDFGRDDWYLNDQQGGFIRQEGKFYGDVGLDTYKGMNASVGDLDGNGKEDVYVSNVHHAMQAEGSQLWMNHTPGGATQIDFVDQAHQRNLLNTNRFGWGGAIGDLDLDGWPDVVQANGMVDDAWDKKWEKAQNFWYYQAQIARTGPEIHSYADKWADIRGCYIYPNEPDRLSLNRGDGHFVDVSEALGFTHRANTRGIALVDLDNDGDLDILVTHQFGAPFLYRNEVPHRQWLGLRLVGDGQRTNREAVGSKVWLSFLRDGQRVTQYREVRLANGFMAQGDIRLLFGLGQGEITDLTLRVHWHNGEAVTYRLSHWNQYQTLHQVAL